MLTCPFSFKCGLVGRAAAEGFGVLCVVQACWLLALDVLSKAQNPKP